MSVRKAVTCDSQKIQNLTYHIKRKNGQNRLVLLYDGITVPVQHVDLPWQAFPDRAEELDTAMLRIHSLAECEAVVGALRINCTEKKTVQPDFQHQRGQKI
jgi:hypothetical protein